MVLAHARPRPHALGEGWIAAGASPKQIATWAGHTSVSVVLDRYGHLYEGNDVDVLARLDSFASIRPDDTGSRGVPRFFAGHRTIRRTTCGSCDGLTSPFVVGAKGLEPLTSAV